MVDTTNGNDEAAARNYPEAGALLVKTPSSTWGIGNDAPQCLLCSATIVVAHMECTRVYGRVYGNGRNRCAVCRIGKAVGRTRTPRFAPRRHRTTGKSQMKSNRLALVCFSFALCVGLSDSSVAVKEESIESRLGLPVFGCKAPSARQRAMTKYGDLSHAASTRN